MSKNPKTQFYSAAMDFFVPASDATEETIPVVAGEFFSKELERHRLRPDQVGKSFDVTFSAEEVEDGWRVIALWNPVATPILPFDGAPSTGKVH